ncbi:MAG: hypothetical protein PWP52_495 [Bacteroidales bacterium]|nr:hypothetical protein [Bacteroidales bacterium]
MRKKFFLGICILLGINTIAYSLNNNKQTIEIKKVAQGPKIDGILDDDIWVNAPVAKDFIQFEPYNGYAPSLPTEVKILYDNHAIYFGAIMYDNHPDSIIKDLGVRDDYTSLNSDLFTVYINTFNDGVNASEFMVSASGIQSDVKHNGNSEDRNWDAVWESKVNITEKGWMVEMMIPYSALRFSQKENQTWGVHFMRHIRRYREWSSWNFIDNQIQGKINQMGEMSGIKDIEPPLRLSVTPYVSAYLEKNDEIDKWGNNFNAGMDLKWGINQSFTLDMILIPDFGQVQSDDEILNISPYEVQYDEKRQFFTEGTELFSKGNIFYSRRIGGKPKNAYDVYDHLDSNQVVASNPLETNLINATKISGRTKGGLGIGFFNAMTGAVEAEIKDTISEEVSHYRTQGFTNYNMIVLDQTLKNNSFISLANTNVLHAEENYNANVTATEFRIMNKENSYQIAGSGAVSQHYTDSTTLGHKYNIEVAKISGRFMFELQHFIESDTYDPNDMGYIQQNNEATWDAEFQYNIKEPFWRLLEWNNEISFYYTSLYKPREYSSFNINARIHATFRNHLSVGFYGEVKPFKRYDFFEPRVDGWKLELPRNMYFQSWISTDYRKKFAIDLSGDYWKSMDDNQWGYDYSIQPRVRMNDKWILVYGVSFENNFNTYGYVDNYADNTGNDVIVMGNRDRTTLVNTFNSSYIFSNKASLSFRMRHYWSRVEYTDFHQLLSDGALSPSIGYDSYSTSENLNYNAFTIDMKYLWRFAPGSELSLVWKNAIYTNDNNLVNSFVDNLENTFAASQINSISLKILYYLDYQYLMKN